MNIELTNAIKERQAEIRRIKAIRPKINYLIEQAKLAERGEPCIPDTDWRRLRAEVEDELHRLGLIKIIPNSIGYGVSLAGQPVHWSNATIV